MKISIYDTDKQELVEEDVKVDISKYSSAFKQALDSVKFSVDVETSNTVH
jgi:hypothetical protein